VSREIKKILISTMPRSRTAIHLDFISKLFKFEKEELISLEYEFKLKWTNNE
jgi:hypothetical protein